MPPRNLAARTVVNPPSQNGDRGTDEVKIGSDKGREWEYKGTTMAAARKYIDGIKFLLHGWIPFGMLTGIIGEPGTGKSALALWLAKIVTTGCDWFDGSAGPAPSKVLWCPTESDLAITQERIGEWGIDEEKLILLDDEDPLVSLDLTSKVHLQAMEGLITLHETPLVVIDSLRGGHDKDENSSAVHEILKSLAEITQRTKAAVVIVHHTKKLTVDEEIAANSSRGSNAIIAMFRSLIGIDKPCRGSEWVRFQVLKKHIRANPPAMGFRFVDGGLDFGPPPAKPVFGKSEKQKGIDWLLENMKTGEWVLAKPLQERAKAAGLSSNAIFRARKELEINKEHGNVRDNKDGFSEWRLA